MRAKHESNREVKKSTGFMPKSTWMKVLLFIELIVALIFVVMIALLNIFPLVIMLISIGIVLIMLTSSILLMRAKVKSKAKNIIGSIIGIIFVIVFGLASYYLAVTYGMFNKISDDKIKSSGIDVTEDPFNIYITGIDNCGEDGGIDTFGRSDVNMIITAHPITKKIMLTSMPRDSYVALHRNGAMDKLTHTGTYGVQETLDTVQDWLGVKSDFYFKVNFSTCIDLVNAIGGIEVESDKEFDVGEDARTIRGVTIDPFHINVGKNSLNGEQALAFARERQALEGGDRSRIENQQRVVTAIINKVTSSKTLLTNYQDIIKACGNNMQTNLSTQDMSALIKMQLEDLGAWTINRQAVDGEGGMDYCASLDSSNKYYVMYPKKESVDAVKKGIYNTMNPSEEELEAAEKAKKEAEKKGFFESLKSIFHISE